MGRWIAFDQETSSLLHSNLKQGARIEMLRRGAVDYALAKPGVVVTLLPMNGDVGIAVFRRQRRVERPAASPRIGVPMRASGFLGLGDELVAEEEVTQEKKSWWKKFWDE